MANKYSNFEEQAKAVSVQRHMINGGAAQLGNIEKTIQVVNEDINSNLIFLDTLLDEARNIPDNPTSFIVIEDEDDMFLVDAEEYAPIVEKFEKLDYLDTTVVYEENWNDYFSKIERYADNHSISFGESPFYNLIFYAANNGLKPFLRNSFRYMLELRSAGKCASILKSNGKYSGFCDSDTKRSSSNIFKLKS